MVERPTKEKTPEEKTLFHLRGVVEPVPGSPGIYIDRKANLVTLKVKADFCAGPARSKEAEYTQKVDKDDLIEIQFEDGITVWLTGEEYKNRFSAKTQRSGESETDLAVPETLDVLPRGMQARGPIGWVVRSLKVIGVDLHDKTAMKIAQMVEEKVKMPTRPGLGFYRCNLETGTFRLDKPGRVKESAASEKRSDKVIPILVFLHGTASSTWGSFGDLWSEKRRKTLADIRQNYGENVFTFEHRTLSESPIENARDLARHLKPLAEQVRKDLNKKVTFHLVSHSRGGMVGELLCRVGTCDRNAQRTGNKALPFDDEDLALFDDDPGQAVNREALQELAAELRNQPFQIGRFVRVACPALGTTLASRRLDRWLSVVGSVAKVAGLDSPLGEAFQDIGEFIAAVVKKHTKPETLPGLSAMMPDSPVVRLLNWREVKVDGELTVIAGDIHPDAWWARLLVWATDRFYDGDHDLVVNTPSMYGGAARAEKQALLSSHKGPNVNHFTYFENDDSAEKLVRALTHAPQDIEAFLPLVPPTEDIARAVARSANAGPRPVVFVLPGIMGSDLAVKDNRVWVDFFGLAMGEFKKLHIDAAQVEPTKLHARTYGDLIKYLSTSQKVVPFPYDWRLPIEQEADRLANLVETELQAAAAHDQPVRLLAHSMGGLVARAMIARHPELWTEVCEHPGARLVMLGTPNGGSHSITEMLVGQSKTMGMLALLDVRHKEKELLEITSRFPGVLAMLPKDIREDYFSTEVWSNYKQCNGDDWVAPRKKDLEIARRFRDLLDEASPDPEHMCYVAGSAEATAAEMYYDQSTGRIRFNATTRGDGRVTWDSGIPKSIPTWYMDVEHGDLAAHTPKFNAISELLMTGHTDRLPQTPPVARAAEELFPLPERQIELYPDREALTSAMLGAGSRKNAKPKRTEPLTRVRVVHGDLAYAPFPVVVGHYFGDPIVSAEGAINHMLDDELGRHHRMNIYPGGIGTCAVFCNPRRKQQPNAMPAVAIVMGLGHAGELTGSSLGRTFTHALLEYALSNACPTPESDPTGARQIHALGISALLVGTSAGGISVQESVSALAKGVCRANDALKEQGLPQRFLDFELIDLFEDQAIRAVRALQRLDSDPFVRDRLDLAAAGKLKTERGGRRRVTYYNPPGWWDRLQILGDSTDQSPGELRFLTLTHKARNELRTVATQAALVDNLVATAIRSTYNNPALARALYERLVPNEIKDQMAQRDNIVLMLDEAAARFPWELMDDAFGSGDGPLAVEHGILRQLATGIMRESPALVGDNRALVVGDPVSQFVELKGAQREALEVARKLQSNTFEVHKCVRLHAATIVQQLYTRAYKVLHLAGHGVFNYLPEEARRCDTCGQDLPGIELDKRIRESKAITGMVLGDGLYLTPAEVKQMRQVPELVFINCCHLGRITAEGPEVQLNRLAANIATEFIRMGVRAVVAAGWAVDDGAAKVFAETFYQRMLDGESFGAAVRDARRATYDSRPGANTWGAYQCYGDPDYHLVAKKRSGGGKTDQLDFVSVNELVAKIEEIHAALMDMGADEISEKCKQLKTHEKYADKMKWLDKDGCRIRLTLARAYGDARCFDKAVGHYDQSFEHAAGAMTFKDIEQRSNLRARAAIDHWRQGKAAAGQIDQAIGELKVLLDIGKTVERWCLLGSAHRRRAWISSSPENHLKNMRDAYSKGYELSKQQQPDAYPLLNVIVADLIMPWYPKAKKLTPSKTELRKLLNEAKGLLPGDSTIQNDENRAWDPWLASMSIDRDLLEAIIEGRCESQHEAFTGRYREFSRRASPRECASVWDNLEFLYTLALRAKTAESEIVAACIGRLISDLAR